MIGLTQITGEVGLAIRIGQFLNGDGFEDYEHAFVALGDNLILQAEPGGAQIVTNNYKNVLWCTSIYDLVLEQNPANYPTLLGKARVQQHAAAYKGIPYSPEDYAALFAHRLHIPVPGLKGYIADTGHMICSQLDDDFYDKQLNTHIFTDGRWEGYVTPGMLWKREMELRSGK